MDSTDYFRMFYTALGGLGLFFLGLRNLSDSLQALSGDLIRKLINYATSNRVVAVVVGLTITTLIQSSSITTVMVIGLVNAGLMQLTQAIGIIIGANIGTTATGWILVINIGKYGLLLIGLGIFPLLFSKADKRAAIGKMTVALGLVFFGLELMSDAFKPLRTSESFLAFLQIFDTSSVSGLLGCVAIGCVLTCIVQSSSAMLGITIALASTGSMNYSTAAGLVLGENIGTTITALLASLGTNVSAKRAAVSHSCFNVLGVLIMVLIFDQYISLVDSLVPGNPDFASPDGLKPNIAAHIAAGHTLFNTTATLVMLPFLHYFARFIEWLIPAKQEEEVHQLRYLRAPGHATAEVSLQMAELELQNLASLVRRALVLVDRYLRAKEHDREIFEKVIKYEQISDNVQKEMTTFVCDVMESSLTVEQSAKAYAMIRGADELESILDYCHAICRYRHRLFTQHQDFSDAGWEDVYDLFQRTQKLASSVFELIGVQSPEQHEAAKREADLVTHHADELRIRHLDRMREGSCQPIPALVYSDIVVAIRRIKNHAINLSEALSSDTARVEQAAV